MAIAVRMPRWGMIMEEGVLRAWLKREGQQVNQGEGIAEVETDKTVNEIQSPISGTLARIVVAEGQTAPVGALLAVISEAGEKAEEAEAILRAEIPSRDNGATSTPAARPEKVFGGIPAEEKPSESAPRISPAARHLAEQNLLNWRSLKGSGPEGRIQVKDVQSALAEGTARGLSPLRRAIARKTLRSIEAPQAALCREIDLTRLLELRAQSGSVSLTAMLIERIAAALQKVPVLNSRLLPEGHELSKAIHLAVVVSTEGGIMVPVIRDVQDKSSEQLQVILADLIRRAGEKTLRPEEMEGSTFTLSNAGPLGIDIFQPLLNPPEVGILGIGRIRKRPLVVNDRVEIRSTAYFCLTTDHRVVDAEPAGRFLSHLEALLAVTEQTSGE